MTDETTTPTGLEPPDTTDPAYVAPGAFPAGERPQANAEQAAAGIVPEIPTPAPVGGTAGASLEHVVDALRSELAEAVAAIHDRLAALEGGAETPDPS